jgi:aldose 1-epimerase
MGESMTDVEKERWWITASAIYAPSLHSRPTLRRWNLPRITFPGLISAFVLSASIMLFTWFLKFTALTLFASASGSSEGYVPVPGADGKFTLWSEGIRANFIPYGASISNLFINDTNGVERDIVLGFDNATYYSIDASHPHLGGVPGRYANRIKNRYISIFQTVRGKSIINITCSSFVIDGTTYHVLPNENDGLDTLHGGPNGWDWRNWTVVKYSSDSITFSLDDEDGDQGFPGRVTSYVTYTLSPYTWSLKMTAKSLTKKTPIMLSSHTYWNLDGFQDPETPLNLNWTVSLPYSGQRVGVDGILIPDGTILPNQEGSVNDFWSKPKQVGASWDDPELADNCGTGCKGYDTCFLVNRAQNGPYDWHDAPVASVSSDFSGIKIDVYTDQDAFQVYSCGGQNGTC